MTSDVNIRLARADDAVNIAAIHIASWQATYRRSLPDSYLDSLTIEQRLPMWEGILASDSTLVRVWVAEMNDEIVGFCSVGPSQSSTGEQDAGTFQLYTIYLQPGQERRGIGGALLWQAEQGMRHLGASSAMLWVLDGNDRVTRFYEAAGWKPDGLEKIDQMFGQTVREVRYSKRLARDTS